LRKEPIRVSDISKVIPIGQKVMVYVQEGNFQGTYSSFIYDIDDAYNIHISIPTNENGLKAVVREGDKVEVSFVDRRGFRVGFTSKIKEVLNNGGQVIYKLSRPESLARVELRENFRVPVLIETSFYVFKKGKIEKAKGTILDISAGGVKLSTDIDLEIRDRLFLEFDLGSTRLDEIEAEVIRKAITGEEGVKHYGLHFTDLSKEQEDLIIKFCLSKQLEIARKMRGIE
jgi:c-di-GMP-binding flagellar brake protein YcgR